MQELDHICIIKLYEVIDDGEDKLYMSKTTYLSYLLIIVMDYASYG